MVRSGTNWVSDWLCSHPDIANFKNSYLLAKMRQLFNPPTKRFVRPQDIRSFMDSVFENNISNETTILESSPSDIVNEGIHISKFIHLIYENAYVIILYRDGKNWVRSLLDLRWRKEAKKTVSQASSIWIRKMKVVLEKPIPKNTIHVKYEDLLYNSADKILLNFLNIKHIPILPWRNPVATKWTTYNPDRWKTMTKEQINDMKIMNPWLEKAGYETI